MEEDYRRFKTRYNPVITKKTPRKVHKSIGSCIKDQAIKKPKIGHKKSQKEDVKASFLIKKSQSWTAMIETTRASHNTEP